MKQKTYFYLTKTWYKGLYLSYSKVLKCVFFLFVFFRFVPNLLVTNINIEIIFWETRVSPKAFFHSSQHPPLVCCKAVSVSERRGGAALWEDNVRRLSNPASMTLPLAVPLDYQPFAGSVTSAGPFTMETPHHSPPTAAHYRETAASTGPGSAHLSLGTSKLTHFLLLQLIRGQSSQTVEIECVLLC